MVTTWISTINAFFRSVYMSKGWREFRLLGRWRNKRVSAVPPTDTALRTRTRAGAAAWGRRAAASSRVSEEDRNSKHPRQAVHSIPLPFSPVRNPQEGTGLQTEEARGGAFHSVSRAGPGNPDAWREGEGEDLSLLPPLPPFQPPRAATGNQNPEPVKLGRGRFCPVWWRRGAQTAGLFPPALGHPAPSTGQSEVTRASAFWPEDQRQKTPGRQCRQRSSRRQPPEVACYYLRSPPVHTWIWSCAVYQRLKTEPANRGPPRSQTRRHVVHSRTGQAALPGSETGADTESTDHRRQVGAQALTLTGPTAKLSMFSIRCKQDQSLARECSECLGHKSKLLSIRRTRKTLTLSGGGY